MSRDPYRSSVGDLGRGERWDRDRFDYERDRYGDERVRFEDDRSYTRGPPPRPRDHSAAPKYHNPDDDYVRDRRYYDEEPRYAPQRPSPPTSEYDRRVVIEKERDREVYHSPSPRRPQFLRRQSSLDTFDRRPLARFYERDEREDYGQIARREDIRRDDFRPPTNVPIPLPRTKALPPPRRYHEREYHDDVRDIRVSEPDYYGDEEYRSYPERVHEKEMVRTRRRNRSRESRTSRAHSHSHHGSSARSSSRSSSVTSGTSSSTTSATTVKSTYPKKGKTRIPARLVSKRAIMDLNYEFNEEGNTIIILKALGQNNIDDLLKLSEDYKKSELEVLEARSSAGHILEERREEEIYVASPPDLPTPTATLPPPRPATVISSHAPMPPPAPAPPTNVVTVAPQPEVVVDRTTIIRDVSPTRSTTTTSSYPVVIDRGREVSGGVPVGPLALVTQDQHVHHQRHRSHSEIRKEIKMLESQLDRERHSNRDLMRAERLSTGELVLYEERLEKIEEPRRGVRIEKDKKGRMSISVPKRR